MKKIKAILVTFTLAMLFASCGGGYYVAERPAPYVYTRPAPPYAGSI